MARILAEGTGAAGADVWLKVGRQLRAEGWPADTGHAEQRVEMRGEELPTLPHSDLSIEVRDRGELLGALAIKKGRGEPVTQGDRKLLSDLASQAGLVLRNVKLIEELRASRQRIVSARDEERRRLERNIHDGAQRHLVDLGVKLGLAEAIAPKDLDETEALLAQLQGKTQDALDNLRDLARGIYPPLLRDQGLVAAVDAQARKASIRVFVEAGHLPRYTQDIEAAVYFCTLEALQNVAKHAAATTARVTLTGSDGHLTFTVSDDGVGFDPERTRMGTGMQGMADRLSALGGGMRVESKPGGGTKVSGELPVQTTIGAS
jgi:signal transduction histidine kinase